MNALSIMLANANKANSKQQVMHIPPYCLSVMPGKKEVDVLLTEKDTLLFSITASKKAYTSFTVWRFINKAKELLEEKEFNELMSFLAIGPAGIDYDIKFITNKLMNDGLDNVRVDFVTEKEVAITLTLKE